MKILLTFLLIIISHHSFSGICLSHNEVQYQFIGDDSKCDDDLANNGAALINSITNDNLSSNTPSTTEKNLAIAMLNYLTKGLTQISQIDEITMANGAPLLPTADVSNECTLDKLNQYIQCPNEFSSKRFEALFGKPITEVVTEHFVGEVLHSRNNTDGENNKNQCLSTQDRSLIHQQDQRLIHMTSLIEQLDTIGWNSETNQFEDEFLNELLQANDIESLRQMVFQGVPDQLPFISKMLDDKDSIISIINKFKTFKKSNPNISNGNRGDTWNFYQSLFSDSDIINRTRSVLADQCKNMFEQFGNFVCKPMKFHAVNNERYYNHNIIEVQNDSTEFAISVNPNQPNSTYYLDYLYYCQGKHCFQEDNTKINSNYCSYQNDQSGFDADGFVKILDDFDSQTFTQLNNQQFRDDYIHGSSNQLAICNEICTGTANTCDPRRTYEQVKNRLKCGTPQAKLPECQNETILSWLEIQEMQKKYQTRIAQYNRENNITEETPFSSYSPFMRHFLGTIGQDVAAGRTPVLTGIKTEDRTPVDRETLAEAAEGRSDFDAPNRDRNPRRKTLTETLADIQQRGSAGNGLSTTEKANLNRGVASVGDALSAARPFTPLQAGSLGSQLASAIPTNDRQAFIEENARLMRDILSGQNRDLRGRINSLDDVLANNERQFNTGVNVNNNFDFPTADDNAGDETNRVSDFGLGVTGAPVEAPNQEADGEPEPVAGIRRGAASSNNSGAAAVAGSTGTAAATGPRQNNSGPSYAATIDNLETITLEELQNQNIPLDRPFILVINAGDRSVSVRVVPMQHRGETILAPDISGIGEDEYFVYPLLKRATVFKKFFAYREERLNSIRSI